MKNILKSVIPTVTHPNQDVRNAAQKILLDVQKMSGCVTEEELEEVPEKQRANLMDKVKAIEVEKNLQDNGSRALQEKSFVSDVQAIKEEEGDEETDAADIQQAISA